MRTSIELQTISEAIASLYKRAELSAPTAEECVVPLGELLASHNLISVELPSLTSQSATNFLLQRGGMLKPVGTGRQDALAGYLYANSDFGCIFVERNDQVPRRRFSAAHELGHYLLHFQPMLTAITEDGEPALYEVTDEFKQSGEDVEPPDVPSGSFNMVELSTSIRMPGTYEQMEREANQFAVELLMPADAVNELAVRYSPYVQGEDLVTRLSTEMLVSRAAMRWRVRSLALL